MLKTAQIHLDDKPKILKLLDSDSGMVVTRGRGNVDIANQLT